MTEFTMFINTWIVYFILALLATVVTVIGSKKLRLREVPTLFLAVIVMGGTVGGLYLFSAYARPAPVTVTIVSPTDHSEFRGHRMQVMGIVSPPSSSVTLVVRSEKDLRWWVQDVVRVEKVEGSVGQWSIDAHIGSLKEGRRENFYIIALAS